MCVDSEGYGGKADEDEGEDDEVAEGLDVWQYDDKCELEHVHEHVE